MAVRVGAGHSGWRRKASSAAPLGAPEQEDGGGNGAQFVQAEPGIGWVPNSSKISIGWLNGWAPKVGLRGPPVGTSNPPSADASGLVAIMASAARAIVSKYFFMVLDPPKMKSNMVSDRRPVRAIWKSMVCRFECCLR